MSVEVTMIKISVDGKEYNVKPEKNLLETCLSIGLNIPHFCYHPALGSVGACRLCAVKKFKDGDDKKGRIVMSCMEPVTEGLRISIEDDEAKAFRAAVIESLMTNHPHDCPVCDEGGECHLQDMTVMTGHNYRRFYFKKRTYKNQNLGPFVNHEMNRCIQCYRCVRFYRDYAGGKDLNVFASRNNVYFGRHEDGTLESEFSGNLVEVCPTGVFTDKTLKKHFTRKWDLSNAPSICVHCSVGCNTIASERYNSLRRIMSRYNGAVNGYFICDRGRFGYEFVNDEKRIREIKLRSGKNSPLQEVEKEILLSKIESSFSINKKVIGIGSPRASVESNFALSVLVGKENFYHGISKKEQLLTKTVIDFLQNSGVVTPSLKQMEKADAIIVLGEDITNTAPMIALALRQATRNKAKSLAEKCGILSWNDSPVRLLAQEEKSPVYIATPIKDKLDDIADATFRGSYDDISHFGETIASSISEKAPDSKSGSKVEQELAEKIALTLKNAKHPLIISGVNSGDEGIIQATLNIALAILSLETEVMVSIILPECNSMGLALIPGNTLDDLLLMKSDEAIDTLVILENDLYRRADKYLVDRLFERSKQTVVLDHTVNRTCLNADILLPASTFAESEGTLVNNEGRAQRFYKVLLSKVSEMESWQWIGELIKFQGGSKNGIWNKFDDIVSSLVNEIPVFSKIKELMPTADLRMLNTKIPRQTIRFSGRTAMNANINVREPRVSQDINSPLAFSMEGQSEQPPSSLVPFYWTPGWNSVQSTFSYLNEPGNSMKGGDPGIRLINTNGKQTNSYFKVNNQSMKPHEDQLLIVPVFKIFGSEEMSSIAPTIGLRIEEAFIYMNESDADRFEVSDNDFIKIDIAKTSFKIKVKIETSLKQGIAGLSVNLPDMYFVDLPDIGKFYKI